MARTDDDVTPGPPGVVEQLGLGEALARIRRAPGARARTRTTARRWTALAWVLVVAAPLATTALCGALAGPVVAAWPPLLAEPAGWTLLLLCLVLWLVFPMGGAALWARRRSPAWSWRKRVRTSALATLSWNVLGLAVLVAASPYPMAVLLAEDGAWALDWVRLRRGEVEPERPPSAPPELAVRAATRCALRGRRAIAARSPDGLAPLPRCVTKRAAAILALAVCDALLAEGLDPRQPVPEPRAAATAADARRSEDRQRFLLVLRRHGVPADPARWDPELAADLEPRGRALLADVAALAGSVFAYREATATLRGRTDDGSAARAAQAESDARLVEGATLRRSGIDEVRIDPGARARVDLPNVARLEGGAWRIDWPRPREADLAQASP